MGLLPATRAKSNSATQHRDIGDQLTLRTVADPDFDVLAFRQFAHITAAQDFHMDEDVGRASSAG